MMTLIFIMFTVAIFCLFAFGRLSGTGSSDDVLISLLFFALGAVLIIGASFLLTGEVKMDTKDEVLQHLNLTKNVSITLDVQPDKTSKFRYKLEDSTHTDLFNYLTEEK